MSNFEMIETESTGTVIKVVGVGGAGGNAVHHMIDRGVSGVEFICANTDAQSLASAKAHRVVQLGSTGLGAGARPDVGRQAAEADRARIKDALAGAHMVFITAGMGGGTGTGAAPIVAEVAKELGALTVAVVTKPFSFEGSRRAAAAEQGIIELSDKVDSLIVILNDKLEEVLGDDVTQKEAFAAADDVLNNAVAGIAEIINIPGNMNVDFMDVKTVMGEQGKAMMGSAVATGPDRARIAAEQAVRSPLLEGVELSGARAILVNITAASSSLKLRETNTAMATIKQFAAEDATVIFGVAYDEAMEDQMRVTVVATGLGAARRRPTVVRPDPQPQVHRRTGTHDASGLDPVDLTGNMPSEAGLSDEPKVWINPPRGADLPTRSEAAARVIALENAGHDPLDIPAFLRRQAD